MYGRVRPDVAAPARDTKHEEKHKKIERRGCRRRRGARGGPRLPRGVRRRSAICSPAAPGTGRGPAGGAEPAIILFQGDRTRRRGVYCICFVNGIRLYFVLSAARRGPGAAAPLVVSFYLSRDQCVFICKALGALR